jgi:hypothetical protein
MLCLLRASVSLWFNLVRLSMYIAIEILLGVILCSMFIALTRRVRPKQELKIYALALVVAALIYVGFAFVGATPAWFTIEAFGLLVFTVMAWLGLRVTAWMLVCGWASHGAWDMLLHKLSEVAFVPDWYPIVCLSFDLLLAGYLAARMRRGASGG